MRILIIVDVYPPEISSAGHLMQELAEGLSEKGNEITVVTSYPRHYLDSDGREKILKASLHEKGVRVIRIKTLPLRKVNFIIRGISQLILPLLFLRKIEQTIKGDLDAVIVYSPPLPLGLIGKRIKNDYGAKFILNVQDIFPQNAIDLGILKNKLLIKFFEIIEKNVYKNADVITFNSEGGRKFLIEKKRIPSEKIITLHNWIDPAPYQDVTKNLYFRKRYKIEGKFIFVFAGVMGPAQGLDFLVKVAKEVSENKNIVFLLIGDGMEKEKIKKMIADLSLKNVIVENFISKEDYPCLLKEVDVGVVCLSAKNRTAFIPGKFLGYLAAGLPVVAFLNKESDGFTIINESKCGYASESEDLNRAKEIINRIYSEKNILKHMGNSGYNYLLKKFTLDATIKKFEELFKKNI